VRESALIAALMISLWLGDMAEGWCHGWLVSFGGLLRLFVEKADLRVYITQFLVLLLFYCVCCCLC